MSPGRSMKLSPEDVAKRDAREVADQFRTEVAKRVEAALSHTERNECEMAFRRQIKVPGPGQFRGEGEWKDIEEVGCSIGDFEWHQETGYLPTRVLGETERKE